MPDAYNNRGVAYPTGSGRLPITIKPSSLIPAYARLVPTKIGELQSKPLANRKRRRRDFKKAKELEELNVGKMSVCSGSRIRNLPLPHKKGDSDEFNG